MSDFKKARGCEKEGRYQEAATLYAKHAFDGLLEANFEPEIELRIGLATMLRAISCDVRADNYNRAEHLFDIAKPLFREVGDDADSRVLVGLTNEWIGDGLLMLGSTEAIDWYQKANESYENLEWGERSWGHEQEFHYASIALESYLTANGMETPKEPHLPLHFTERIEFKIETTEQLLERRPGEEIE